MTYETCKCGHRHDRHRHHGTLGCYEGPGACPCPGYEPRPPATRVENVAILPGGGSVVLTPEEMLRAERGEPLTVAVERASRTVLVGDVPEPGQAASPDVGITTRCVTAVLAELERARIKFPGEEEEYTPEQWMLVVVEEVGEVARAIQDETLARQYEEMVQQAAMALRMLIGFSKLNNF